MTVGLSIDCSKIGLFNEAVVYGYACASYARVGEALFKIGKGSHNYLLSSECTKSLSGREFTYAPVKTEIASQCKLSLVSVVIENYLREREGLELIPVLFCLTSDKYPTYRPIEEIANKQLSTKPSCGHVTHKELRLIYKLCTYSDPDIQSVAKRTFKFIHVRLAKEDVIGLDPISAPWENSPTDPKRAARWLKTWEAKRKSLIKPPKPHVLQWRVWLQNPFMAQAKVKSLVSLDQEAEEMRPTKEMLASATLKLSQTLTNKIALFATSPYVEELISYGSLCKRNKGWAVGLEQLFNPLRINKIYPIEVI